MESVKLHFNHYYNYQEITEALQQLVEAFPNLTELSSIGKSYEGRDVWCITITNFTIGQPDTKPAIYIDGNTHAGEVTGSITALYTAYYLLKNYQHDKRITNLVNRYTFYIIPRVNPDGAELYLTTPHMLRSSVRPWPDSQVTELPGLHRDDIDGNGFILTMRVRDDLRGEWKISADDSRLLEPRKLDDIEGQFLVFENHSWNETEIRDS